MKIRKKAAILVAIDQAAVIHGPCCYLSFLSPETAKFRQIYLHIIKSLKVKSCKNTGIPFLGIHHLSGWIIRCVE